MLEAARAAGGRCRRRRSASACRWQPHARRRAIANRFAGLRSFATATRRSRRAVPPERNHPRRSAAPCSPGGCGCRSRGRPGVVVGEAEAIADPAAVLDRPLRAGGRELAYPLARLRVGRSLIVGAEQRVDELCRPLDYADQPVPYARKRRRGWTSRRQSTQRSRRWRGGGRLGQPGPRRCFLPHCDSAMHGVFTSWRGAGTAPVSRRRSVSHEPWLQAAVRVASLERGR
jgi:hypothetical protein